MKVSASTNAIEALLAFPFLASLDGYYPGISEWYVNTVVPGLAQGDSLLFFARDEGRIAGMALGKKGQECKLRCVRVLPEYANHGLGIRLIDKMLDALEQDKPHCTVSEELLHPYSRAFINRYGFRMSEVTKGQYRPRKLEYHFNGSS